MFCCKHITIPVRISKNNSTFKATYLHGILLRRKILFSWYDLSCYNLFSLLLGYEGPSWDRLFHMVTSYEVEGRGIEFRYPAGARSFALLQSVLPKQPPPHSMGNAAFFQWQNGQSVTDYSLPPSAEVKNVATDISTPQRGFMAITGSLIYPTFFSFLQIMLSVSWQVLLLLLLLLLLLSFPLCTIA